MADRSRPQRLEVAHPNAAGIDIGSGSHFVAVRADLHEEPVREFGSFTEDLESIAAWLTECGVDVVAMESTGVYWIPLYELLESRGFTVYLGMRATCRMSRAGSQMCWTVSGCSS